MAHTATKITKVTNCLRDVFVIQPEPALLTYKMDIAPEAKGLKVCGCVSTRQLQAVLWCPIFDKPR